MILIELMGFQSVRKNFTIKVMGKQPLELHRTVRPNQSEEALITGRCIPSGNEISTSFEVHYNPEYFVFPPGKDNNKIGGLSLFEKHTKNDIVSQSWEDTSKYKKVTKNGRVECVSRFFCYRLDTIDTLPENYNLKEKKNKNGYLLYPQKKIQLEKFQENETLPHQAVFPGLKQLKWVKCCVIERPSNEQYKWMNGNGIDPPFDKHTDPDCDVILTALREAFFLVDYEEIDELDDSINLVKNITSFIQLKELPREKIKIISFAMEELMNSCYPDDAMEFQSTWVKFSAIEDEISLGNRL